MRLGPDLSPYGDQLPDLEDLAPEEVRYLCDVCRLLRRLGVCSDDPGDTSRLKQLELEDESMFDRDELGIDPEEDYECQD